METPKRIWFMVALVVAALLISTFPIFPEEGLSNPTVQRWVVVFTIALIVMTNDRNIYNKIRYRKIWHTGTSFVWYVVLLIFVTVAFWNSAGNHII